MIDYLLKFADIAAREARFPTPEGSPPSWSDEAARTFFPVRIIAQEGTYDSETDTGTAPVIANGSWIGVRTNERDAEIEAMDECMLVTSPELAVQGLPFIYIRKLPWEAMAGRVEPLLAGTSYPFGPDVVAKAESLMIE